MYVINLYPTNFAQSSQFIKSKVKQPQKLQSREITRYSDHQRISDNCQLVFNQLIQRCREKINETNWHLNPPLDSLLTLKSNFSY